MPGLAGSTGWRRPIVSAAVVSLTIIDEALANVVENNKVTVASLAQVISYVTPEIRHELPEQRKHPA